mmetsp:Transcript_84482/g.182061  ORF Transcript_84482/g.182061 Transcript_84482/m.182061 type:complete len:716 (-) Transcript_84482:161-2308(-)
MTAVVRSTSPTTALYDGYQTAAQKRARMIAMGLHVFYPEMQGAGRIFSQSFREVKLKIFGTEEQITFPVQTCTKVKDVKEALAGALMVDADSLIFLVKGGCSTRQLRLTDEMSNNVTVRGITSFKPAPHKWPHPVAIIGSGYHGLKTAMAYTKWPCNDIVVFDRNDRVGGYCWITAANKTSKLQTEMGAFHVWWGQEYQQEKCSYPSEYWPTWPMKEKILEHFQHAAEQYGVIPHIKFQTNVSKIKIVGDPNSHERYYSMTADPVGAEGSTTEVAASCIYSYPGSLTKNRIIDYPGEDIFEGHIGYGMNDDTPYEHLGQTNCAILGNGAFAVENARTCLEHGSTKVFLVTRRKNLASPRVPCWFVHQGPVPTPGRLVLNMFKPCYEQCGFGDPWEYWSVNASADRQRVQVTQSSRFGIGDVTFLAVACGKLEYVQDTLKRCTKHCLHLTSGRKLEDVTVILKALGLLGDFGIDRLHRMKQVTGCYCEGDWRRVIFLDATGMNAANFTTFSTGIGTTGYVRLTKFLFEHPKEYYRMKDMGLLEQLPMNKAKESEDKPAYVYDVNHTNSTFMIMNGMCPRAAELGATDSEYKHRMYHVSHPVDRFLKECIESWDAYQAEWKKQGCTHPYVEYPYTKEMIQGYFDDYVKATGVPISINGPGDAGAQDAAPVENKIGSLPVWAQDDNAIVSIEQSVKGDASQWWGQLTGQDHMAKLGKK